MKTFFCRPGNKSRLAPKIVKLIPPHKVYVEPFVGSAAIYFKKPKSEIEILNDIDKNLMDSYKLIKKVKAYPIELPKDIKELNEFYNAPTKNDFEELIKSILRYCHTFSSNGKGKLYKDYFAYWKLDKLDLYKNRLKNTRLENKDYKKIINDYDGGNTFFYLDPPYENSKGLYKDPIINYEELRDILKNIKGKFLLSLNDSSNIRNIFSNFKIRTIKSPSAGGITIGSKDRNELLISNY